ncbi:uncharacterized protein [Macrobrachium rosenbergii]|uniref:uncharacterized protein n=1 Tax=Macrobrachium rosenbergii TaxID=79674 RepID=UPI0034D49FC9
MYVRKRKTLGTTATNERSGGKDSQRDSSRGHAAEGNQRDFQSRNVSERRNLPYSSENKTNWASQRSQENRHLETQRPPPFKSLVADPVGKRDSYSDRRNADFDRDRGYQNKSDDIYNSSRAPYGERHDRWNPYDQRESSNRGNYMESQRRNEGVVIKTAMEKIFSTDFKFGNTPFANIDRIDDRCGMDAQRGGNNNSQMNQGDMLYPGRRNDTYYSDRRDEPYYSDRRDEPYYSDRRDDPYYSDKRGYGYSDRRHEPSPERRGHSSYSERRGDSYSERGHGSYPGRRGGEPSPERGNFGYYQDRRESDSYPARRYESHSDRRIVISYADKGYAPYRDRRDGDCFSDRRGSDYYPEKRNSDPYPDGRGSPYEDGRVSASYMDYERSSNLSYKDPHRGADNTFMNRERVDNSFHVDQYRRVDSSYESWQKQDNDSYLDKPRGRNYPVMDIAMEENVSYENEKKRSKDSAKGQRADEGRSFGGKPRRSNQGDDLKLPSKDEKQAAMGILKKVLAKQQNSKSRRGLPSAKPDHDGIQNSESSGDLSNRNGRPSKRNGVQSSIGKGNQGRKIEGNVRKKLPRKRPLKTKSSPQNKKPRISVLSRLGPKLETASKEVFLRLGSRTGSVKSRLGPRSFPAILPGQDKSDTGEPVGQKKFTPKDCLKMGKKYSKHLSATILRCNKCKRSKFLSVQKYLLHQIDERHELIDASFHKKIECLYKYLRCDAQLAYAIETGVPQPRRATACEICGVREKANRSHFKNNKCRVVHEYANPSKCCQFGRYSDRSFFENHIHSLTHFVKKSKMLENIQKRYQSEKEKLELMKKSYLNGVSISKTKFLHEVLWREAKVCEHFGEVAVPKQVSSLLQTFEDLAEPLPDGKVLNRTQKLKTKYYDPSNVHGKYQIIFETSFRCDLCGVVLERSQQSLIDHCSTKEHYDSVVKEQQRLRESAPEVKVKEEKDVTETENGGSKETEAFEANKGKNISQQSEEDGNDDFNDTEVYGDHHDGKMKKQAHKEFVAEKEDSKPASKKTGRKENEDAKEMEIDGGKESEQPEEIQDELGEENDKHEDDDIDIYSDPYGGGELLEGVEERQEVGCDDEEYGEDGNAQEQDDEDEANEEASSDNDAEVC